MHWRMHWWIRVRMGWAEPVKKRCSFVGCSSIGCSCIVSLLVLFATPMASLVHATPTIVVTSVSTATDSVVSAPKAPKAPEAPITPADTTETPFSSLDYRSEVTPEPDNVVPMQTIWNIPALPGFQTIHTDSTLRWSNYINPTNLFALEPGFVPYRTGMIQRKSGWFWYTYSPEDLRLQLNGLSLADPVTGQVALYRIPLQHVASIQTSMIGSRQDLRVQTKDHYIVKPRTYLNYDESDFSYRHLEFAWQQPLAEATYLELSYWDRRDGTGYSRGDSKGHQIGAQLRHKLSAERVLRVGLWQNRAEREESFGYVTQGPGSFVYNRFTAQPNQSSARSEELFRDLFLQVQEGDSVRGDVKRSVGFAVKGARRDLFALGEAGLDTTSTNVRTWEVFARMDLGARGEFSRGADGAGSAAGGASAGGFGGSGGASAGGFGGSGSGGADGSVEMRGYYHQNLDQTRLAGNGWLGGELRAHASYNRNQFSAVGMMQVDARDDGRTGGEISGALRFQIAPWWSAGLFSAMARRSPDLQSLYWMGNEYEGVKNAPQEYHYFIGTEHSVDAGRYWRAGFRAEWRTIKDETVPDLLTQRFVTRSQTERQSLATWIRHDDQRRWEGQLYAGYLRTEVDPLSGFWDGTEEVVRLGAELFVKGAVFQQAAYVKAGFRGSFVPYQTALAMYNPWLNRWQMSGTGDAGLSSFQLGQPYRQTQMPAYARLDAEISARIRWFMMLFRWENAADGLGQAGMMETFGYPMPSRRLILSLRILFLN